MESTIGRLSRGLDRLAARLAALGARLWPKTAAVPGVEPPRTSAAPVISLAAHARRRYPRGRSRFERRAVASVIPLWLHTGRPHLESR